nr:LysR family transcriptional regulator [uncultured Enterobacter sp.]
MANLYDLKKFDLNLLVIFECIYQHQSISKAAETLFITPSAVSQSLQRLRTQLNDPLFIRSGKGVVPTTVGINLHQHLEENLNQLEKTINIMNSSELSKTFVIYSPQLLVADGILTLIKMLREKSGYAVEHRNIFITPESVEDLLSYRKADLIVSLFPLASRSIACSIYKREPLAIVCRKDHPRLTPQASAAKVLEEDFTFFSTPEQGAKNLQISLETLLPNRNILFRSDCFISILTMISHTDLVGIVPVSALRYFESSFGLMQVDIGKPLPAVDIFMMYNRTSLNDNTFAQFIENMNAE